MGFDEKETAKLKPWLPEKWDFEADVVVVGYGGAGVCAAITVHDAGAKVLILEKAPVAGGNTTTAAGAIRIPTNVPDAIEYYRALTQGAVDEKEISAFAEAMVGLTLKLEAWGAELKYSSSRPQYPAFHGSKGFSQVARLDYTARQLEEGMQYLPGNHLFNFFDNLAKNREIKVIYETPVKELIQDAVTKEILGVKAESLTGEIYVKARRSVVLACGGFQNNHEMLVNFLPYASQLPIYPLGTPYNTGDGILMASEVGAKLWHMAGVEWGNLGPKVPSEKFGVGFRLRRQLPAGSQAINVNKHGKRFMDESVLLSHRKDLAKVQYFSEELGGYPNIPLYTVFDETYRKKGPIVETVMGWWRSRKLYDWSDDNSSEIELGWIVKADTIKELAEKIRVDSDALAETVSQYNEYCTIGEDPEFSRAKGWLARLETPPYYATEL